MESTEWTQQLLDAELYLQASTSLPSLDSFQLPNKTETSLKQKAEDVTCADEDQQLLKEVYANLSLDQKLFKQEEEELHAQRVPDFCRKVCLMLFDLKFNVFLVGSTKTSSTTT